MNKRNKQQVFSCFQALHPKQFLHLVFLQLGADNAELAGDFRCAFADIRLFGNHVEVEPAAFGGLDHALGTQDDAVDIFLVKFSQDLLQIFPGEFVGGFPAI